jgi:hypothetical protein
VRLGQLCARHRGLGGDGPQDRSGVLEVQSGLR